VARLGGARGAARGAVRHEILSDVARLGRSLRVAANVLARTSPALCGAP
jgi:hypothetical protein